MIYAFKCYEDTVGELLLGLSLTLSGPIHEVRRAQVIQQSLEPLESTSWVTKGAFCHRFPRFFQFVSMFREVSELMS